MKKLLAVFLFSVASIGLYTIFSLLKPMNLITGAPPYHVAGDNIPKQSELDDDYAYLRDWKRPAGPARVGLQAGHLNNEEIPDELHRLRGNTGATGGGKTEAEVNLEIAEKTKEILEQQGIIVDILPATIPPAYWADVFVAIHADGSLDPLKSGYKGAVPRRDFTNNANDLLEYVENAYEASTGLVYDPNVTRNMRGYYAFSFWRYKHALHPMTTAMILETGFLTSAHDRQIIVSNPNLSATGLANGLIEYLTAKELL